MLKFFVDFLFPKKKEVLALEAMSAGEILRILPPAQQIDDDHIIALFDYKHNLVRELIWELKYTGSRSIAQKMAGIILDVLRAEVAERALFEKFTSPLLIPVPISDKRRNERGWNQAELLAEAVAKLDYENKERLFKYLPRQLVKHRHTESQTKTAGRKERLENLKDSMKVLHPPSVEERCVILLDDVTTTGSTFAEAKRALKAAGARKILCVALAH